MIDDVTIPDEVCDCGTAAVEIFLTSIAQGNTEQFAVMCATRKAPGLKGTDSQNFASNQRVKVRDRDGGSRYEWTGSNNPFPNMPEQLRQHYIKQCKKQGISFEGKVYKTSLVRQGYGGLKLDPEALVDSTQDVRRLLKQRGWSCQHGMVKVDAPELIDTSDGEYHVSEKLLDEHVANEAIMNHGGRIKKKDYADIRAKVKAKLEGNK